MAFNRLFSFKSSVTAELDIESGRISLSAQIKGNATCDAGETPERLRTSGLIPREGDSFPDNVVMVCKRVQCEKVAPLLIEFTCDYGWTTPAPGGGGGGGGAGGIPQHWSIAMETLKGQYPIDRDIDGFPLMTVTGERFDPPLMEDKSDLAYVFSTQNRPFNETMLQMYIDSVSSDVFRGNMPGACKIDDIRAQAQRSTDGPDTMSCQIRVLVGRPPPARNLMERLPNKVLWRPISSEIATYTWQKRVRGEGYYEWDASIANYREARDALGEKVVTPVLHSIPNSDAPNQPTPPIPGTKITNPEKAQFYSFKTKYGLPFQTLFNAL